MVRVPNFNATFLSPVELRPRSKIIENLAVVNYDTNNLYLAPYDWRLSYWNLEERDGYFSRLKSIIEEFKWGRPSRKLYRLLQSPLTQKAAKKEDRPRRTFHGINCLLQDYYCIPSLELTTILGRIG